MNGSFQRTLFVCALVVVAAVAAFYACKPREAGSGVRIGVILAETGSADFIGKPERKVLEALVTDLKKTGAIAEDFELKYLDSGTVPDNAETHFDRLAREENLLAVIGPSTSGESILVAKKAEQAGIPLLSLAASKKIVTDEKGHTRRWVFKFAQNDDLAAEKLIRAMVGKQHRSVAFLHSQDGFGKSGAEVFAAVADRSGLVTVSHLVGFPAELSQPEPFANNIPRDVNAVVVWGTAPGPALLVQSIRRARPGLPIYLSHGNASPTFIRDAGPASEGCRVVGSRVLMDASALDAGNARDAVILQYQRLWGAIAGGAPSHFAGHARDALIAIVTILRGKQARNREELRAALEGLRDFQGVTGTFNFSDKNHAGLTIEAFEIYEVRNGGFIRIDDK